MTSTPVKLILLSFAALCFTTHARAQTILSDFNSAAATTDGWQKFSGGDPGTTVGWTATGGSGATGGLVLNDAASGGNDYFDAPSKFLGDLSAFYGGTLAFDLKITSAVLPSDLPEAGNMILTGSSLSVTFTLTTYPVTAGFTTYSINLLASSGWFITGTTTAPTQAEMLTLLGQVTDFRILADWHNGPENDVLDNVRLTAVPEPAVTTLLSGCGVLTFAAWALRRKHRSLCQANP